MAVEIDKEHLNAMRLPHVTEPFYPEKRYVNIKWQEGTVVDKGINGVQISDVLKIVLRRLEELNSKFPCRENEDSILMIEQAILHQNNRDRDRRLRKVEGTYKK